MPSPNVPHTSGDKDATACTTGSRSSDEETSSIWPCAPPSLAGQPPKAPDAFEISVAEVTDYAPELKLGVPPSPAHSFQLHSKVDPPLESNDTGSANITIDGVVYPVQIMRNDAVGGGERTDELKLVYVFGNDTTERQIPVDPQTMQDKLLKRQTAVLCQQVSALSHPVRPSCSKKFERS